MSIQLNNVTLTHEHHPVVHHLSVSISSGEWLAVVGPNGAGKSTLLDAMAGLSPIHEGSIEGLRSNSTAYLPQQAQLDISFPITVCELVATGLWPGVGIAEQITDQQLARCWEAVDAVGLQGFESRLIGTLSGGQLQRALFARVLLQDHPVILLDEPFNAIDLNTLRDLTTLISRWHQEERTIVMVTHDLDYVQEHCPRTLLLARECIDHGATHKVLTPENLRKARRYSEAFDLDARWCALDPV
ncbi:MAG: ABC transporter ATP-binding protein [Pseudomonadota bacterium]